MIQRDGTAQSSFTTDLLEEADLSEEQEEMIRWSAHAIYAGGTDTVRASPGSSLHIPYVFSLECGWCWFFLPSHDYVPACAKEGAEGNRHGSRENSFAYGSGSRITSLRKRDSQRGLADVPCCPNRSVFTLIHSRLRTKGRYKALPHAATEDDIYEGYHIPKGATVFGNS